MTAEPAATDSRPSLSFWDVLCVGPIVLHSIYFYLTIPLGPSLIGTRPLLLSGLRGSVVSLLTVGAFVRVGSIPLWAALIVPIPNLLFDDPFMYWAGARYGRRLLAFLGRNDARSRRRIARGERLFARYGTWAVLLANILPVPSALIYLAAGETRMRIPLFLLADIAGLLLFIGACLSIGWLVGQPAADLARRVSDYGGVTTIALIAGIVAWSMWSAWRGARDPDPAES